MRFPLEVQYRVGHQTYEADLERMVQKNVKFKSERRIRPPLMRAGPPGEGASVSRAPPQRGVVAKQREVLGVPADAPQRDYFSKQVQKTAEFGLFTVWLVTVPSLLDIVSKSAFCTPYHSVKTCHATWRHLHALRALPGDRVARARPAGERGRRAGTEPEPRRGCALLGLSVRRSGAAAGFCNPHKSGKPRWLTRPLIAFASGTRRFARPEQLERCPRRAL